MGEKACNLSSHLTILNSNRPYRMADAAEDREAMERNRVPNDLNGLMNQTIPEAVFAFGFSSYIRQ